MQPACCYFTWYKGLICLSFAFYENIQSTRDTIVRPYYKYASVDPRTQVCSSSMSLLLVVGNLNFYFGVYLNVTMSTRKVVYLRPAVLELNYEGRYESNSSNFFLLNVAPARVSCLTHR
jgi:hypothetical protein